MHTQVVLNFLGFSFYCTTPC